MSLEDLEAINIEFAKKEDKIPTFTFSKIFDSWFNDKK